MARVVITGVMGHVGRSLANRLSSIGYEVIGIDRVEAKAPINFTYIQRDLKEGDIANLLKQGDRVIHLCAQLPKNTSYRSYYEINRDITKRLVEVCIDKQVKKLFYLSTTGIYYNDRDMNDIYEGYRGKIGIHPYVDSKYQGEKYITSFSNHLILRTPAIISREDKFLLEKFQKLNKTIGVPLINGGVHKLSYISLDRLIDNIVFSIESDIIGIYNTKYLDMSYRKLVEGVMEVEVKFIKLPKIFLLVLARIIDYVQVFLKRTFTFNSFAIHSLIYSQCLNTDKFKEKYENNNRC